MIEKIAEMMICSGVSMKGHVTKARDTARDLGSIFGVASGDLLKLCSTQYGPGDVIIF